MGTAPPISLLGIRVSILNAWWPGAELNCRHADFQSEIGFIGGSKFNNLPGARCHDMPDEAGRCTTDLRKIPAPLQAVVRCSGATLSDEDSANSPHSARPPAFAAA